MEKVLSRHPLTSMTCAPERIGDLVWRRRWNSFETLVDTIHQSQSSGLPERGLRPTLEQSTRRLPLPKSHCVRHRRTATDNGSPRLNVRAMVEENVDCSHVIATRSPVERSLGMAASAAMVSILLGKWPGQSVATWSSVRSLSTLVFARLEFWLSSRFNDLVSPLEIASTAAAACFNDST